MLRVGRVVPRVVPKAVTLVISAAAVLAAVPAFAQSNLDAGKSPAQIFSDTCGACHRSPRELRPTSPGFLREHYTTGAKEAATMAAYLASVGSDPRAVQQRKPPAIGANKPTPPSETSAAVRPPQTVPAGAGGEQARPEAQKPETQKPEAQKPETQRPETQRPETQAALPAATPNQRAPATGEQAKFASPPRRPSDSVDAGNMPSLGLSGGDADVAARSAAAPAARPHPVEQFEE